MPRSDASPHNAPENVVTHHVYIPAHHHYPPHTHEHHELVVIQQGRFRVRLSSNEHMANPGDILLYPTGTMHEEWAEDGESVLTWVCAFRWDGFTSDDVLFCHDILGHVQELVAKLAWEFRMIVYAPEGDRPDNRLALLQAIIEELKRLAAHGNQRMVDQVRAFVHANITKSLALEDLAAVSGLSISYFGKQYRTVTGRTPMEDARLLRIEEARRLIMTTSMPLHEIAPKVGLVDEHHLSRLLKNLLGVTTRELRRSGPTTSTQTNAKTPKPTKKPNRKKPPRL